MKERVPVVKHLAAATKKEDTTASAKKKSAYKYLHVRPDDDGWKIQNDKSTRVRSFHDTQREAIEVGRAIAKKNEITLVIHRRDGRVRKWESYQRGPKPPRQWRKVLYPTTPPRTASRAAIRKAVMETIRERSDKEREELKNIIGVDGASRTQR